MSYHGYIDSFTDITFYFDQPFSIDDNAELVCQQKTLKLRMIHENNHQIFFETEAAIELNHCWFIHINDQPYPVYIGNVVRTEAFDTAFYQPGTIYGALYHADHTVFTVWSPVADHIELIIENNNYDMAFKDGDWTVTLTGDYRNKPYLYGVHVNHEYHCIVDPYTKGLSLNSRTGIIVDPSTAPSGFYTHHVPAIPLSESIIYEVHVRDFSMHPDSGVNPQYKGKFPAVNEPHTHTANGFSTGFDYIRALGITHVELLPINDFAQVDDVKFTQSYNWGYDPMYFQTPDGSLSICPEQPEHRIIELKQLIMDYHQADIGIILDVVFNHVYDRVTSSFERLVPGYYFRYFDDLSISNGTGVGNDFASERLMARKFIIDTLTYYVDFFKVDGFRFDLMGAIDIDTMIEIEKVLRDRNPNILLLGEGWQLNTALPDIQKTTPENGARIPFVHFFNDQFRDIMKGDNFNIADTGYMNGNGKYYDEILKMFRGEFYQMHVRQSINYTEVHDNHTLYDRIQYTTDAARKDIMLKIHQMTTVFTILSQGIPFIHAGQEFFRTKHGHGNTYNLSDYINRIDWARREKYDKEINVIKKAIALKKQYEVFRFTDYQDILTHIIPIAVPPPIFGVLMFDITDEFIVLFNPTGQSYKIELPRLGVFNIELSNTANQGSVSMNYPLQAYECCVLRKKISL